MSNRTWLGMIAETIKMLCTTLIGLFSVMNKAVEMADESVTAASEKQTINLGIDLAAYANKAREDAALARVKAEMAMREYIGGDSEKQKLIDAAREQIDQLIAKRLAARARHDTNV